MINPEIKDVNGIRKQKRERAEFKSTLVTTPVVPVCYQVDHSFKYFFVVFQLVIHTQLLSLSVLQCWTCE